MINVIADKNDKDRNYSAWIGGSVLCSLESFES